MRKMQQECCLGGVNTFFSFSRISFGLCVLTSYHQRQHLRYIQVHGIKWNISFAVCILHRRLGLEHAISLFADDVTEEIRRTKIFYFVFNLFGISTKTFKLQMEMVLSARAGYDECDDEWPYKGTILISTELWKSAELFCRESFRCMMHSGCVTIRTPIMFK